VDILKRLREAVCRKRAELWPNDWILNHNNASVHKMFYIKQFLTQKSIIEVQDPPCSPDLAPNVFWLFPKLSKGKKDLRILKTSKQM
jgi:hypothetical protein